MRQIAEASQMWTQDHEGKIVAASLVFVLGKQKYDPYNPEHLWWGLLYPYTKNKTIFSCPSDAYRNVKPSDSWITYDLWKTRLLPKRSYMINLNWDPDRTQIEAQLFSFLPWGGNWTKESIIQYSSKVILFSEYNNPYLCWGVEWAP